MKGQRNEGFNSLLFLFNSPLKRRKQYKYSDIKRNKLPSSSFECNGNLRKTF